MKYLFAFLPLLLAACGGRSYVGYCHQHCPPVEIKMHAAHAHHVPTYSSASYLTESPHHFEMAYIEQENHSSESSYESSSIGLSASSALDAAQLVSELVDDESKRSKKGKKSAIDCRNPLLEFDVMDFVPGIGFWKAGKKLKKFEIYLDLKRKGLC